MVASMVLMPVSKRLNSPVIESRPSEGVAMTSFVVAVAASVTTDAESLVIWTSTLSPLR